jgi:hypothetical protein
MKYFGKLFAIEEFDFRMLCRNSQIVMTLMIVANEYG